ncbi:hypothetical protein RDV89_02835 [Nocardioides zeae]|uniref:CobQ/CobB/MinD/ParA nucleotide binding domain-containing protein n=1 Tax=Nocardioides imazamoxiresistens TaxID=3231893 RepID=A0ABU3PRY7_9ACTN|nr:hypothetical protein [Nocardioides zeae]MDT9591985.1 hypothetical protein [Nocardioides zeae]
MICVLVVGAGAAWEPPALNALNERSDVTVLKRCVDVNDLLAVATLGQADVAVVGLDAPGLDGSAVEHLRRHRVRTVGVATDSGESTRARAARIGIRAVAPAGDVAALVALVQEPPAGPVTTPRTPLPPDLGAARGGDTAARPAHAQRSGGADVAAPPWTPTTVAVWGPAGAPGRTTTAVGLAAALGRRGEPTLLVDADPWGGAVAQQLGVVDDVSGLLQVARSAAAGDLARGWTAAVRRLERHLHVLSGLPRPERWDEVEPQVLEDLIAAARHAGHVVVDTGFSLETDETAAIAGRPERNGLTLAALERADVVVAVGTADPVGLARLTRGLAELRELSPTRLHVVVNRARSSLGWSTAQVHGLVAEVAGDVGVHFLPDDQGAVDRALVTGRHVLDGPDGPLVRALVELAAAVVPSSGRVPTDGRRGARLRRRTAGTARRR